MPVALSVRRRSRRLPDEDLAAQSARPGDPRGGRHAVRGEPPARRRSQGPPQGRARLCGAGPAVRARDGGAARPAAGGRQPHADPDQRRPHLSPDAAGDRGGTLDHHVRDLHLLVREGGPRLRRRALGALARRRQGAHPHRLGRQPEDGGGAARADARGRGRDPQVPPAALVLHRPRQQSNAPQAAGGGRRRGIHRRRGHRRRMERRRAGSGPLARYPLPHRGPGARAHAGGVRGQLDGSAA